MDKLNENTKENSFEIQQIPYELMLQNIIDFIRQKYEPVDDLRDADINISLKQIFHNIRDFYPIGLYSETDIMNALVAGGFKYDTFGELQFYWKMRIRQ